MTHDKHQPALDGIRGFAALSVVLYHVGHWLNVPIAPNSSLAVDLFFMLSGYVLTLAYARRLDAGMTLSSFILTRFVRLMPLVVFGTVISVSYLILRISLKHENISVSAVTTAAILGTLNLPYLTVSPSIGGDQVFPLNGPQYSLFFEIVANVVWAAIAFLRRGWIAGVLSAGCFILLLQMSVLGGDTPNTFIAGFPRVGASFLGGVALFHLQFALPSWRWWPAVFWICFGYTIAMFYLPVQTFEEDLLWTLTVSPLLVLSGAQTALGGRVRKAALLGGRLSYPIYVLHYPLFTWVNGAFQTLVHRQDAISEGPILVATVVITSLAVLKFYDEPIRSKLNGFFRRPVTA